jgi:hypothetical protein
LFEQADPAATTPTVRRATTMETAFFMARASYHRLTPEHDSAHASTVQMQPQREGTVSA